MGGRTGGRQEERVETWGTIEKWQDCRAGSSLEGEHWCCDYGRMSDRRYRT